MANVLRVPVRRPAQIPILARRPEILRAARRGFEGSFFAFDIDQTLLRTDKTEPRIMTTFTNRPVLDIMVRYLERGIPVAVISGNEMEMQKNRVIPALTALLKSRGELHLLSNFHFFANTGASRLSYTDDGRLDAEKSADHCRQSGIAEQDAAIMRETLGRILAKYAGVRVEERTFMGALLQVTIKPFPKRQPGVRERAVLDIRKGLIGSGLDPAVYRVLPGGSTSVDISRRIIRKAYALDTMIQELGIPRASFEAEEIGDPVLYFGDEFTLKADEAGNPVWGNDVSVLQVPNVIAFAVNADQSVVPDHSRLIKAGSGPQATLGILRYFSLVSEVHRTVPRGTRIEFPDLKVPVINEQELEIPESLRRLDFQKAAIVLRVNTLLADPSREGADNIGSTEAIETAVESPVLAPVIKLLEKGIRIVLLSGDARERQTKRVVRYTIFKLLKDKSKIANLTLYANGGATKTTFTVANGKFKAVRHNRYSASRRLMRRKLEPIAERVIEKYIRRLQRDKAGGNREAEMYLAEIDSGLLPKNQIEFRSGNTQLAINYIMPNLRDWVRKELRQALKEAGLADKYVISEGGIRTIDINKRNAGKTAALEDFRSTSGIDTLLYFGAEFSLRLDAAGKVRKGNDMEVLGIPKLIAFAHNRDQAEVHALRSSDRIIAAGSGANAAYVWLDHIAENLSLKI